MKNAPFNIENVSRETLERLKQFEALLVKWNKAINLISKGEKEIWQRHIIDSAQLLPLLKNNSTILTDLGSGAGFPGLILSYLGVENVHLVESDGRKCAFLTEAARLSPGKITIHHCRIEQIEPWETHVITARALAPLSKLIEMASVFGNKPEQYLFLKGAQVRTELDEAARQWKFDHQLHASVTQTEGFIVELTNLSKRGSNE